MADEKKFWSKDYQVYKPNPKGTGAMLALSLSSTGLFLNLSPQAGTERKFDYKNKVSMKVDVVDIARFAEIIKSKPIMGKDGAPKEATIFHSPGKGSNKILTIVWSSQFNAYYLSIAWNSDQGKGKVGITITEAEASALILLMNYALPKLLFWDRVICEDSSPKKEFANIKEDIPTIQVDDVQPASTDPTPFDDFKDTGETINADGEDLSSIPF